jgi:hypothetical protein
MDKEKIERKGKEEEELDGKMEQKERENGEKIEEEKEQSNYICFFFIFILKIFRFVKTK